MESSELELLGGLESWFAARILNDWWDPRARLARRPKLKPRKHAKR
jgi:hypothetical protein